MNNRYQSANWFTRGSYLLAGGARGMIGNGVSFFLLIYYSQAIGLDPKLAGLALLISLCFDAVSDPIIGYWSDRFRSRWGRRHPFMYVSILPISLFFYGLWPPGT
jgi:Na+/melibiose symporter-like transporter